MDPYELPAFEQVIDGRVADAAELRPCVGYRHQSPRYVAHPTLRFRSVVSAGMPAPSNHYSAGMDGYQALDGREIPMEPALFGVFVPRRHGQADFEQTNFGEGSGVGCVTATYRYVSPDAFCVVPMSFVA